MLDYLKGVDDFDALFFMPAEEDNQIFIQSSKYINPGQLLNVGEIGPSWHVVLFRTDDEEKAKDLDHFEAIFSDPREYISGLIDSNWYGVVAKKTTTSHKFIKEVLDNFRTLM